MIEGTGKLLDRKGSDVHRENLVICFKVLKKILVQECHQSRPPSKDPKK
jgi:hypothetical protein